MTRLERLTTIGTVLLLAVVMLMLGVAYADDADLATTDGSEANKVSYWCEGEDGIKYEPVETPFIVPAPPAGTTWTLIVLKGGTTNETESYPVSGQEFSHSEHANSHVILCWEETSDTTTTTVFDTTTTAPTTTTSSSTTSTTVVDSTTTTDPATTTSSSTTTTVPVSTTLPTTSTSSSTTTTTGPTTTTDPPTTTTVMTELPMTGSTLTGIAVLGAMMLSLGLAFLYSTRKTNE